MNKNPYKRTKRHREDPVYFARRVLGVEPWSKQVEALTAVAENERVAVKSGNGLGKGFSAAAALLWFMSCHDHAVALSTAPTFRQVRHILWKEVHRRYRNAKYDLGGKLLDTRLEMPERDSFAMGLSADSPDEFQGFHSANMLIVVDEAEGVAEPIYEAIEALMTSENCRLLLIGNPTTVTGSFRRAFHEDRELYHTITISAYDSPNVAEGAKTVPGLVTARWVEQRRKIWGEDNPIFQARVLGEFPEQSEDTLISLSAIEGAAKVSGGAVEQDDEPQPTVVAVDVARFGSDRSVILVRQGGQVKPVRTFRGLDTMKLTGLVVDAIKEADPDDVVVDEVGIGAGVVDRLKELGYRVDGVNVGRAAHDPSRFANLRAEGYWNLRQLITNGEVALPSDKELMGELAALKYSFNSTGQLLVESKEDMRKRGIRSPDKADAMMLAFLPYRRRVKLWG